MAKSKILIVEIGLASGPSGKKLEVHHKSWITLQILIVPDLVMVQFVSTQALEKNLKMDKPLQ